MGFGLVDQEVRLTQPPLDALQFSNRFAQGRWRPFLCITSCTLERCHGYPKVDRAHPQGKPGVGLALLVGFVGGAAPQDIVIGDIDIVQKNVMAASGTHPHGIPGFDNFNRRVTWHEKARYIFAAVIQHRWNDKIVQCRTHAGKGFTASEQPGHRLICPLIDRLGPCLRFTAATGAAQFWFGGNRVDHQPTLHRIATDLFQ